MIAALLLAPALLLPSIIPKPVSIEPKEGSFVFQRTVSIRAATLAPEATKALTDLLNSAGVSVRVNPDSMKGSGIWLHIDSDNTTDGDEGYRLEITPRAIALRAHKPAGLYYAVQTLRQLMPAELETGKPFRLEGERLRCVAIEDRPRFSWRGMHLDESRHFYGVAAVKRYIDLMAMHKMNVFHWHLVDDGGWRIQIKKYPKLTDIGAWRRGTGKGWDYINIDFVPQMIKRLAELPALAKEIGPIYGGYYTQDEIQEIVRYAADRFVQVVPEIEMPGHALPAPFNYNEVGCDTVSVDAWKQATGMRYSNVYCAGKEATFEFVQNVLDEVISLFPSPFLHIGGDEVDKRPWAACPSCQKRKADEGLKDEHELQSYFVKRVEKYLNSKGKRMIGWDEILEGGLAPNATVMSWRGVEGGIAAAKSGHDVVMSPTSHCYFDYSYATTSTEHVYGFEPIPAELDEEQGKRVLGAQGNVWTEWMEDFKRVEQMAYPRAIALAEVVWSPNEGRRWIEFQRRLGSAYKRLAMLGVNFDIPQPTAKVDAMVLRRGENGVVEFEASSFDGSVLRYSTNGKLPTVSSPIYKGPIEVREPCEVSGALFFGSVSSQPVKVSVVALPESPAGTRAGRLSASVIAGRFTKVSDIGSAAAVRTLEATSFDIGLAGLEDNFAIVYSGLITIAEPGIYTFATTSDDGSVLEIAGARVVDNDGLHAAYEKSGRILLPRGVYSLKLSFFEQGGAQRLEVSVTPPNGSKMPLPFDWLSI